jgi:hypothetical protein
MDNTQTTNEAHVTRQIVPEASRMDTVDKLFGLQYVLKLEPLVFPICRTLG